MKTRLACRLARTVSAVREYSPARHLAACPDCQAWLAASTQLDTALRRSAPAARPPTAGDLDARILAAVRAAEADAAPASAATPVRGWLALATGLTVAAVLAFTFSPGLRPDRIRPADEAAALAATVGTLSAQLVAEVLPTAGTLLAENPLQDELTAVYSDARSALNFLALNFLPGTAADTPAPRPRNG
jgi:hypothetical protein